MTKVDLKINNGKDLTIGATVVVLPPTTGERCPWTGTVGRVERISKGGNDVLIGPREVWITASRVEVVVRCGGVVRR